jgi:hypothetical protein
MKKLESVHREGSNSLPYGAVILSYNPKPWLPFIENIKYKQCSFPMENYSSGNGKVPCWCGNMLSLAHAGILHSSMLEAIYGMEECKMPAWATDKMFPHQQGAFPFPELQLSR